MVTFEPVRTVTDRNDQPMIEAVDAAVILLVLAVLHHGAPLRFVKDLSLY